MILQKNNILHKHDFKCWSHNLKGLYLVSMSQKFCLKIVQKYSV